MEAHKLRIQLALIAACTILLIALVVRINFAGGLATVFGGAETVPLVEPEVTESISEKLQENWKASLQTYSTLKNDSQGATAVSAVNTDNTMTDTLVQELFMGYVQSKTKGQLSTNEARQEFAEEAATALLDSGEYSSYTASDIRVDTTGTLSPINYIEEVAQSLAEHSIKNEHELVIFNRALETEDPNTVAKLRPIAEVYVNVRKDLEVTSVPTVFTEEHLALLQSVDMLAVSISGMQRVYEDPTSALVHFTSYQRAAVQLSDALTSIQTKARRQGVSYGQGAQTAGAFFMAAPFK